MAQFTVYRNKNLKSKAEIPYLLNVQSDLLSGLATRVVIPIFQKQASGFMPLTKLTPEIQIDGDTFLLMTPQLAGIAVTDLGDPVCELSQHRGDVISAIDLLITGF